MNLDFLVPISFFLLVFLIIYGIFQRLKIFSSFINFVISLSVAFYSFLLINYYNLFSKFLGFLFFSLVFFIFVAMFIFVFLHWRKQYREEYPKSEEETR